MTDKQTLDRIREIFSADRFATSTTGIYIEEASKGHSRCSLDVRPELLNANGVVMGGALFTLADFAFAVASNCESMNTVGVTSQISFMTTAKGSKVTAEARCAREGRNMCFYEVTVSDDTGRTVAKASMTGHYWDSVSYGVDPDTERIDYDQVLALAKECKCAPINIANAVVEVLKESNVFESVEAVMPGFINMNLSSEYLAKYVAEMAEDAKGEKDTYLEW